MGDTNSTHAGVMDGIMAKNNGYPIEFRVVNLFADTLERTYFPATIAHHITIRSMTDDELENAMRVYTNALGNYDRHATVQNLVEALLKITNAEFDRRTQFKSGAITLETYYPEMYNGNVPKVVQVPKRTRKTAV
jgi:hypothetical protein